MEKAIQVINEMEAAGVIRKYALGGGIAVLFYAEPVLTYDLDVFVFLPESEKQKSDIIDLEPIYNFLRKKGYPTDKEHILIENIPVQWIPVYNDLIQEAVENAVETTYKGIATRVVGLEYLMAILLQTGRAKDRAKMALLLDQAKMNEKKLSDILNRHSLKEHWNEFKRII